MYLWSLIDDSSRTFQSSVYVIMFEEVNVMSMTDFPTGEWKVGVEPLLRMCSPCWKISFSRCSPLLSEVRESHRLLRAFESIPQMNLVLDEMQCSVVCVSLVGRSLCWPAQYAEINHISSICPL